MNREIYLKLFVLLTLVAAWIMGSVTFRPFEKQDLVFITDYGIDSIEYEGDFAYCFQSKTSIGLISTGRANGYGGPMEMAILVDSLNQIKRIEVMQDRETVSYMSKLRKHKFFDQFIGKKINDLFIAKQDIDAVAGATISSAAIAEAVRSAAHSVAKNRKLEVQTHPLQWKFGSHEIIVIIIFLIGLVSIVTKQKKVRYLSLICSFIVMGFIMNASLSISHFGRVFLGFFPDYHQHFVWWLLMAGTLAIIVGLGKNIYCSTLCPFGATQILLHKISGLNFKIPTEINKILRQTPGFLLWFCLIIILLYRNPTIASYEPFAMLFSLNGVGIQWYILPVSIIGSLFLSNFFCNFFCPVGAGLRFLVGVRRMIIKRFKNEEK